MNNTRSFIGGWAAFAFFTCTGATLGMQRQKGQEAQRREEEKVRKVGRDAELLRIAAAARLKSAGAATIPSAVADDGPATRR